MQKVLVPLGGLAAIALIVSGCGGGGGDDSPANPLVAQTAQGEVQGAQTGNVISFKSIPYAAAPVGALRWKPPTEAPTRSASYAAVEFKAPCTTSEDCLHLSIYKPASATPGSKLPVVMWIHGGGLGAGTGNEFNGATLAEENGLVVVAINYRLGALGFFAHPALTAEGGGTSGNYGMLDQQAAMKWIRANIDGFGGNAANLTIFGQSAGGLSVYTHLASPLAAGLFDKALVISGGYQRVQPALSVAETLGQTTASTWGCTGATEAVLACLRALPVATARAAPGAVRGVPSAVVDGKLLRESTSEAFASGRFNRVPVISGSTQHETANAARAFANAPLTTFDWATVTASAVRVASAAEIAATYDVSTFPAPTKAYADAYGDFRFFCGVVADARSISAYVPGSWTYEFAGQTTVPTAPDPILGPFADSHSTDLPFWFGQFPDADKTATKLALSAGMRGYLANFAKSGNPNGNGLPVWKTYAENTGRFMSLGAPLTPDVDVSTNHRCQFWATKPPSDSLL